MYKSASVAHSVPVVRGAGQKQTDGERMNDTRGSATAPSALGGSSGGLTGVAQTVADGPVGTTDHRVNETTVRNTASASHAQVVQLGQRKIAGDQSQMDKVFVH